MYHFLILDPNERDGLLLKKGLFLMKARSDEFTFSFFSFEDFYGGVVMKKLGNGRSQNVPFKSGLSVEKCLDDVEISGGGFV